MSEAKHTRGPWLLDCEGSDISLQVAAIPNEYRGLDCCIMKEDFDPATVLANAQLIAAAPDLLYACQEAYKRCLYDEEGEPITHQQACYCTDTGAGIVIDGVLVGDLLLCSPCRLRDVIAKATGQTTDAVKTT